MENLGSKGKYEIVRIRDETCGITGDEIETMKPCVELFGFLKMNSKGIEKLERSLNNENLPRSFSEIELREGRDGKCNICSFKDRQIIGLFSCSGVFLMKVCKRCFLEKIQGAKEIINIAIDDTIYFDETGFTVWENNHNYRIEDFFTEEYIIPDYGISIGFDNNYSHENIRTGIGNTNRILKNLEQEIKDSYDYEIDCDTCEERRQNIISLPKRNFENSKNTFVMCENCRDRMLRNFKKFVEKKQELVMAYEI